MRKNEPFSENKRKAKDVSAEDCLVELRRLVEQNPEKVISRNFFRVNSSLSESSWNRYYGTFQEFKRQAGVTLSRQQHLLEKQIAKHASTDHYREITRDRTSWGDKYKRKNKTRYQTLLFASDFHDKDTDLFSLAILVDTAERLQPDVICLGGDLFDLPEFGRFSVDPRDWDVVGRIKFAHERILAPLRRVAPDAQIDLLQGNHEFRLLRHLCDATPALRAVLGDLHGFTVAKLFGLDQFEVNFVAKGDLTAFRVGDLTREIQKNHRTYFGSVLCHHTPDGKNLGLPGINGHHHKLTMQSLFNETFGSYQWVQAPGMCKRDASYTNGEKWTNGFVIVHVDTEKKQTIFEPVSIGGFACIGGRYYHR